MQKALVDRLIKNEHDYKYYIDKYPKRNLDNNAIVTRFAPSPTGFVHMGSLYTSFIASILAHQSNGVFYLRIEDTDQKREVENGVSGIVNDLKNFDIEIDEGESIGGLYGPYTQSQRKDIYLAFAKYLLLNDYAYPCFCSSEDLEDIRKKQESKNERLGYYGDYAKCRNLSDEMIINNLDNNMPYVIRLKSRGNFSNEHLFHDEIKGDVNYHENDLDIVLIKSDGLPTYHFAHAIDDSLMHTTHVVRGDEWLSSLPIHLELFASLNFPVPLYCHVSPLTKKDGNIIRKLSKRKDLECRVSYYSEKGIPSEAIKLYLCTLGNTNFEEWHLQNQEKSYKEFTFTFNKMPIGGTLFDLDKLMSISKDYFAFLSSSTIYDNLLIYSKKYDSINYDLIKNNKDYLIQILNIERNIERPRKDISSYSDIIKLYFYMFDDLFISDKSAYDELNDFDINIIKDYFDNVYDSKISEEDWFNSLKEFATNNGYTASKKDYKENPELYKGTIATFCEVIRVIITKRKISPNLYDILKLLSKEQIDLRVNTYKKSE